MPETSENQTETPQESVDFFAKLSSETKDSMLDQSIQRLIRFNVEVLAKILRRTLAVRNLTGTSQSEVHPYPGDASPCNAMKEVAESLTWEHDIPIIGDNEANLPELPDIVKDQLQAFVATLAALFNENEYHNFAHASHSVMAVNRFWNRMTRGLSTSGRRDSQRTLSEEGGESFRRLLADPFVEFACAFATLLKDIDHPGVDNSQLVAEGSELVAAYGVHSLSQQNAMELAWKLFNYEGFRELRLAVCPDASKLYRFKRILIHAVLATDFQDEKYQQIRNDRWETAFSECSRSNCNTTAELRATATLETLMEASELAHKMQHWEMYVFEVDIDNAMFVTHFVCCCFISQVFGLVNKAL